MVTIKQVETKGDLRAFIEFPYQKYRRDPHWVPPLRMSEWERFDPKKNPFYEHARIILFLAEQNNQVVGRIAGIDDDVHNNTHHDNLAFFGFFEANDQLVANALFETVENWAKQLGRSALRGPANPSMNDGAGFQINAFDTDPYIMMPANPPEYPAFAEAAGYSKIKDLYAWHLRQDQGLGERVQKLVQRVKRTHNPTLRTLNMKHYKQEVDRVLNFYNDVWEENWGQTKYTDKEARHLANELRLIIDPEVVIFMEFGDELAGVAVGFPNANQLFKKMNGRLFPFGIFYALRSKHYINEIRLPILGVKKAYRNKGLELLLIEEFHKRGSARGYEQGELSWILEDNDGMNKGIAASGARQYKTYRLYQKAL